MAESSISNYISKVYKDPLFSAHSILGAEREFTSLQIQQTVGMLSSMEPFAFETFVKQALIASYFRDVRVTKRSSDGGIDVVARMPLTVWPIGEQIIQVQAKRWLRPVGRREVAELRGSLLPRAIGVIMTTGN